MLFNQLVLPEESSSTKRVLIYLVVAYLFAFGVRALLYFQTADIAPFWHEGMPIPIWSPDAGLYGYYAKQLLAGGHYPFSAEYMPGHLIAAIVTVSGISLDTVMFWLPALLSSLIVIPVILSAYAYRQATLGFAAALIAGAGANYYTRSHLGYMDTDTLNVVLPWMAAAFWIVSLRRKSLLYALLGALFLLLFKLWYHSAAAILFGMVLGLLLTVVLFYRKRRTAYAAVILAAAAAAPFSPLIALGTLLILSILFYVIDRRTSWGVKPYLAMILFAAVAAAFVLDMHTYLQRALDYFNKPDLLQIDTPHGIYRFRDVLSTVIEAEGAPIWKINMLYGGMLFYIVPAVVGFFALLLAYRAFFITLVLLLLGLSSAYTGIRFTIFATPALALGFAYFGFLVAQRFVRHAVAKKGLPALLTAAAVLLMLFNIIRFNAHLQPFYFKQAEVKALDAFAKNSTSKDLLLSWWDFGWPLWYYTGRNNTLIDNGLHGSDTFLIGNMLLSSNPAFVANSAKFATKMRHLGHNQVIPVIAKQGDVFETFKTFSQPQTHITAPGDAYILLHRDMLAVLPTIASIADRDPRSGEATRRRQFYISDLREPFTAHNPVIYGDTFKLDLRNGVITGTDGASARINTVVVSENGQLKAARSYDPRSAMFMIIYNKTKALYMDGSVFNSFLIQSLLLDRYDHSRFEKVADTGMMKILKVR